MFLVGYSYYYCSNFRLQLHQSKFKIVKSEAIPSKKSGMLTYRPQPPSGSCTDRRYRTISFFQASARGIFATWHVMRRPAGTREEDSFTPYLTKRESQHGGGLFFTRQQEERTSVVASPVAVLGLEVAVKAHPFESCFHSRAGRWRVRHKPTLWRKWSHLLLW